MIKPLKIVAPFVISLSLIFLTSCQNGQDPEELLMQQYEENMEEDSYQADYDILDKGPEAGGTLNMFTTNPDSLNPVLTKNIYVSDFLSFVYEGLARLNEKQQAEPMLSDSWSVSADGLIWNFHIRDGVKWHDGQTFTASDVEFTIQTLMNPAIDSGYKPLLTNIATCAAVDSSNIRLVLKKPNSFTPEMMTFPILQKEQFRQKDFLTASGSLKPVGTGPYKFISYDAGKRIVLKSNTDWWYLNVEGSAAKDGMYIETINVNIYSKPDDVLEAFQTGDIDVVGVDSGDLTKYAGRTDLTIKKYTSRDFEFLSLNLSNPALSDVYARKAISLAINREELIAGILPGGAEAAELPVLPENWINLEGNESSLAISADKPKPEDALKEGGWSKGADGYYKRIKGIRRYLKVELLVNSNNSIRAGAAQKICSQLERSGIKAECLQISWDEMLNRINTSKYDIAFLGCRVPQIPDLSYLYSDSYLSAAAFSGYDYARNISGYHNTQVDADIKSLFGESSPERMKTLYKSVKEQVLNDSPYIGLYFLRNAMAYSRNLRGPLNPDIWNKYNNIYQWYKLSTP